MNEEQALKELSNECEEINQRLNSALCELDKNPENQTEIINSVYRDIHTLKGSCQLFGLNDLGQLAHVLESSLSLYRDNKTNLTPQLIDYIYQSTDLIEKYIPFIVKKEFPQDLKKQIEQFIYSLMDYSFRLDSNQIIYNVEDEKLPTIFNSKELKNLESGPPIVETQPIHKSSTPASSVSKENIMSESDQLSPTPNQTNQANQIESTVRVHVGLLDKIMNLVGELVLTRNQLLQVSNNTENNELTQIGQHLDIITGELQGEVMKTRMQPIGNVLNKFQRVVRDLARDLEKKINLTIIGAETELDKTLLEAIKDPLTHIIRNSCDHGIEPPSERQKSGKSEKGEIIIQANHEGGQVVIAIHDDGKGLDPDRILNRALEKEVITHAQSKKMSQAEILNLIFAPGFSTADQVSKVSGRGVGMDVVKTNIEKIGGTIDLSSEIGKGSSIKLQIPLTLAVLQAIMIRNNNVNFAIAQSSLVELVCLEKDQNNGASERNSLEIIQGHLIFRLRGKLIPIVDFKEVIEEVAETTKRAEELLKQDVTNIAILNSGSEHFGLIVDEIIDTSEIVVKPLGQFLRTSGIFSGATILGNGQVALILDVPGISKRCSLHKGKGQNSFQKIGEEKNQLSISQEYLIVELNSPGLYSIPLCLVHRLEEIKSDQIDYSGDWPIIQYRNTIMPLIGLGEALELPNEKSLKSQIQSESSVYKDGFPLIVFLFKNQFYGLVVNEIQDIVSIDAPVDKNFKDRPEILGNIVSKNQVYIILDILKIIKKNIHSFSSDTGDDHLSPFDKTKKILLVEDTNFFRKQLTQFLNTLGHEVESAEHGEDAIKILQKYPKDHFSLILTDIEMPVMDGMEFAQKVRQNTNWDQVPILAISTKYDQEYLEKAKSIGFNGYLEKLNMDTLAATLEQFINVDIDKRPNWLQREANNG